jgi:hypothetical protein
MGLILTQHHGFNARRRSAAALPTLSFRGSAGDATNSSSYSFGSLDIGTASATRRVFVAVHNAASVSAGTPSGVTINGVGATDHGGLTSGTLRTSFFSAIVSSGTTGITIAVTFGAGQITCAIGYWSAYDLRDSSPLAAVQTSNNATADLSMTTESNCIIIGAMSSALSGVTHTFTGVTERYDASPTESLVPAGGDISSFSGSNPTAVNITAAGSVARTKAGISWR